MLRFSKNRKSVDQIDFEHEIVLNQLKHHINEIKTFYKRLEDVLQENGLDDSADEYQFHLDILINAEKQLERVVRTVNQLKILIDENGKNKLSTDNEINSEKHQLIIAEWEKVDEMYLNVREKILDFIISLS